MKLAFVKFTVFYFDLVRFRNQIVQTTIIGNVSNIDREEEKEKATIVVREDNVSGMPHPIGP